MILAIGIFILNMAWADGTTLGPQPQEPIELQNRCTKAPNFKFLEKPEIIRAQCSPLAIALAPSLIQLSFKGMTSAGIISTAFASKVTRKISTSIAAKAAARMAALLTPIGYGLTAFEIMGIMGKLGEQAKACQLHEHDLKRALYEEVNLRGKLIQETLQKAGFSLTEQQKR